MNDDDGKKINIVAGQKTKPRGVDYQAKNHSSLQKAYKENLIITKSPGFNIYGYYCI